MAGAAAARASRPGSTGLGLSSEIIVSEIWGDALVVTRVVSEMGARAEGGDDDRLQASRRWTKTELVPMQR